MCCCRVTARAVRPLARAPRGSARSPPSPPGACSLKPARGSRKEIKTRAWGKEGCKIMHHFIWPVKHQRSAIGAVREGKGRTRHWGVRSKARGAHCQGSEGASKEAARRKSLAVRTQKSYGNPQQQHNAWSYTEETGERW